MTSRSYEKIAACFKALAHPARLEMLDLLRGGELCVCHLERALDKRQAYISQQLMVLREAGVVASRKEGLSMYYRISDAAVFNLLDDALGPIQTEGHVRLEACPCPGCSSARVNAGVGVLHARTKA
ncbi:MAG: helix-turn-helix transcriptional regulator [Anaerolineales bacterium]|nr:helix-turn-helix transcriptional regulator [Anaerolineales bacterium]